VSTFSSNRTKLEIVHFNTQFVYLYIEVHEMTKSMNAKLKKVSDRLLGNIVTAYKRDLYSEINFDSKLVLIKGFRGVGKTTLLLQYVKENYPLEKSIFLSLDHIYFASNVLFDTVDYFYENGIRYFILDEVHKYKNWSQELKNIYDSYPDARIMATSSSALEVNEGNFDLSRRADVYHMKGLSFKEYLEYKHQITIPLMDLESIITNKNEIHDIYFDKYNLKTKFDWYIKKGYYPYFKEAGLKYHDRLSSTLNLVLDVDLPSVFQVEYESIRQVKKLLSIISKISPFTPNVSELSRKLQIERRSILYFLDYLETAGVITMLRSGRKSDSILTKPEKILIENTNLLHMLASDVNLGTQRETFVANALSKHELSIPRSGDLIVNMKYTVEIGGPSKAFRQIKDVANPLLILDTYSHTGERTIPMWMLGLL